MFKSKYAKEHCCTLYTKLFFFPYLCAWTQSPFTLSWVKKDAYTRHTITMLLTSDRQSQQALCVYRYSSRRVLGEALPLRAGLWSSWQRCDCITAARRAAPWLASGQNSKCLTRHDLKIFTGSNVTLRKQHCWRPRRDWLPRDTCQSFIIGSLRRRRWNRCERASRPENARPQTVHVYFEMMLRGREFIVFIQTRETKSVTGTASCGCEKAHQRRRQWRRPTWKPGSDSQTKRTFAPFSRIALISSSPDENSTVKAKGSILFRVHPRSSTPVTFPCTTNCSKLSPLFTASHTISRFQLPADTDALLIEEVKNCHFLFWRS